MGFFSSIGKVFKKVTKAVGSVAKKALPSVLSIAKMVPGVGTIANYAEAGINALGGGGGGGSEMPTSSPFVAEIGRRIRGDGGVAGSRGRATGGLGGRKKVVIWK